MSNDSELWNELTLVFRDVFQDENLELTTSTKNSDIDQWTSLNHALLIDALEQKFNIEFEIDEILSMHSVNDIFNTIRKKKNE